MLWLPIGSVVTFRVATPPETVTEPRVVAPSLKVTFCVGAKLPTSEGCTVAVRTTCCPNDGVVVLAPRSVVVGIVEDNNDSVAELVAKLESPA
jgi:hypothetical protein